MLGHSGSEPYNYLQMQWYNYGVGYSPSLSYYNIYINILGTVRAV